MMFTTILWVCFTFAAWRAVAPLAVNSEYVLEMPSVQAEMRRRWLWMIGFFMAATYRSWG